MKKNIIATTLALSLLSPLFAFAQEKPVTTGTTINTETRDIICVSKAFSDKETALIGLFDSFSASMKTTLTARKDALVLAISITDKTARKTARLNAHAAFKTAEKTARTALREGRQKTHESFKVAIKACGKQADKLIDGFKDQSTLPKAE